LVRVKFFRKAGAYLCASAPLREVLFDVYNLPNKALDKCINMVDTLSWRNYMEAVVKKWGNSLGIRIPNLIVRELSLKDGSFVDINDKGKVITIKPIEKLKLSEMLDNINEQNIHKEIETGDPVGKEVW